jgi:phenylacetate-CoA ligase
LSLKERFYLNAPGPIQNVLISIYGLDLKRNKHGFKSELYREYLRRSQWKDRTSLNNLQLRLLRWILKESYEHVPFYRKRFRSLGISPEIRKIGDLTKIPILTKEDLRGSFYSICSDQYSKTQVELRHTGGTTGKALKIFWGKDAIMREYAFVARHKEWGGVDIDEIHATFGARLLIKYDRIRPPFWRYNFAEKQCLFSMYHLKVENLPIYVEQLRKICPSYIEGYPSFLYVLAEFINQTGTPPPKVRAIFTSSEKLLDFQRNSIQNAFETKVFDRYGNIELAGSAGECEFGSLHINSEYGIIEVVKEGENVVGETGELICTNFVNPAMPLIRYEIGDVGVMSEESCPCGRGLPVLREIIGRVDDIVVTPEGVMLGTHVFHHLNNIKETQIIQDKPNRLKLRVVPRETYTKEDEQQLLFELRRRVGPTMQIDISYLERIPREPNGKFRAVISSVHPCFDNIATHNDKSAT